MMALLTNGLIAGSLAALVASGLALVYGVLGVFNLALGQLVLIGGYTACALHDMGFSLFVSIVGGIAFGGLASLITYEVFVRPFVRFHPFLPLVTTIAWSMMLDGLILLVFSARPRRLLVESFQWFTWGDVRISLEQILLIVSTLLLIAFCAYVLHSLPIGRKIRAVVQHDSAASSLGISSSRLRRLVFVWSGVLAAAAGIFLSIDQTLTPVLGFPITIKAYAAVIAGGKGNVWGAILCAYVIALLEQLVVGIEWFGVGIPAGYQGAVALFVILIFLLVRPQGLFAVRQRTA